MMELLIPHLNELALTVFGLGFTAWAGVVVKSTSTISKTVRSLEQSLNDSVTKLTNSVAKVSDELGIVRESYEELASEFKQLLKDYHEDRVESSSRLSTLEAQAGIERRHHIRRMSDRPEEC